MLNYVGLKKSEDSREIQHIDVLNDIRSDVSGISEALYAFAATPDQTTIRPESLKVMADTLALASSAMSDVTASLENHGKKTD